MRASICYVTGRKDPRLDFVLKGLFEQRLSSDDLELVVVDFYGRTIDELAAGRNWQDSVASLRIVRPKPTIWQGEHRVTVRDRWAMSNARNTAFVYASRDYVAFLDDRCELGIEWLTTVRRGEIERCSVLAGTYDKHEDGRATMDPRRNAWPQSKKNVPGGNLFGCTFAMPLEFALAVNGFEEGMDGMGFEDCIFGMNLANAGYRIDFEPSLFIYEHRGASQASDFWREDKGKSPADKSHASLARFGKRTRTEFTPDLRALREMVARGLPLPAPTDLDPRDWYDGTSIRELA